MGEALTVLPFQNTLATFKLKGSDIIAALENGLSQVEDQIRSSPGSQLLDDHLLALVTRDRLVEPEDAVRVASNRVALADRLLRAGFPA